MAGAHYNNQLAVTGAHYNNQLAMTGANYNNQLAVTGAHYNNRLAITYNRPIRTLVRIGGQSEVIVNTIC